MGLGCFGVGDAELYGNMDRLGRLEDLVGLTCDGKHLCAAFHDDCTVFGLLLVLGHDLKALLQGVDDGSAIGG